MDSLGGIGSGDPTLSTNDSRCATRGAVISTEPFKSTNLFGWQMKRPRGRDALARENVVPRKPEACE
jgi:hypothetical protein